MMITQEKKSLTQKPKGKNHYKHFNRWFLTLSLSPLFLVGLLNYWIDPYGINQSPQWVGFNVLKPKQDYNLRLFKPIEVIEKKPSIIFLGSSRTILGLDPNYPVFPKTLKVYNLGLTGPDIREIRHQLDHAMANQPDLDTVILGLDFFMFKKKDKNSQSSQVSLQHQDLIGKNSLPLGKIWMTNFSLSSLESSFETVKVNLQEKTREPYYIEGMRNNKTIPLTDSQTAFRHQIKTYLNTFYYQYQLSDEALKDLQEIVNLCHEKGIKLKVFISPIHATQLETIRRAGLWQEFQEWKTQVSQITPVLDFADYNSITTEPMTPKMKYFFDSAHSKKEVGDQVLSRLYSDDSKQINPDFGILLTPKNIKDHLSAVNQKREEWAKNNPEVLRFVQEVH